MSWYTIDSTTKSNSYDASKKDAQTKNTTTPANAYYESIKKQNEIEIHKIKKQIQKEQSEYNQTKSEQNYEDNIARNAYEDKFEDDPLTQMLNLAFINTVNYKRGHRYDNVKGSFDASNVKFNMNDRRLNFYTFAKKGIQYSAKKGDKLAKTVANNSVGFTGYCSKYVSNALRKSGLGKDRAAAACQMGGSLANNKNFREIYAGNVNLASLPAGCILVYNRGAAGYSSKYGHIEVTLGDGRACSDGVTNHVRSTQGMRVFVPVENA